MTNDTLDAAQAGLIAGFPDTSTLTGWDVSEAKSAGAIVGMNPDPALIAGYSGEVLSQAERNANIQDPAGVEGFALNVAQGIQKPFDWTWNELADIGTGVSNLTQSLGSVAKVPGAAADAATATAKFIPYLVVGAAIVVGYLLLGGKSLKRIVK